ncbi:MAG TPA: efflux RND transporter periplasmic adaptor subunit [Bryobacteraceae bacterium]|nr:efflux RND transporter periplasmic adaptor subunit [Bryobacteraceae bacterium]
MKLQHLRATLILTSLGLFASACSRKQADGGHHEEAPQTVVLTTPSVMNVPTTQAYVCRMQSRRHIEIRALNEGYLEEIPVQEGQAVRAGERLYELYPVLYRTQLEAEKAELRLAEINLKNTEQLAGRGFVSAPELARATAERDRAKAKLDRATAEYGFTRIVAPFDGIVGRQLMQHGSLIEAGDTLTTMSDNAVMWAYFNVPEADYLRFKSLRGATDTASPRRLELRGATIQLRMANGQIFDRNAATTLTIESEFNKETGNIEFRADFPNPQGLLRHGQTGTLLINQKVSGALVIPQRATFEILDRRYVFVVDKNAVAHQREITVARELEDIYVIKGGLSADERFVLDGVRQVRDGERLKRTETRPPKEAVNNLKHHAE